MPSGQGVPLAERQGKNILLEYESALGAPGIVIESPISMNPARIPAKDRTTGKATIAITITAIMAKEDSARPLEKKRISVSNSQSENYIAGSQPTTLSRVSEPHDPPELSGTTGSPLLRGCTGCIGIPQ